MKKLFFALITSFIFVATAWGQCTKTYVGDNEYTLETTSTFDTDEVSFEIAKNRPIKSISFDARTHWAGLGKLRLYQVLEGGSEEEIWSVTTPNSSYFVNISSKAIKIKFVNTGTNKKYIKNVIGTYAPWIEIPTDDVYFGIVEKGASSQRSITIEHSALNESITASTGSSAFTFSNPVVKSGTCGPTTLNITFKPNAVGAYSDVITFSNGTKVNVYGECSKSVCTILEVAKISYTSVLLRWNKVVDADLSGFQIINQATGAIYYADKDDTSLNVTGLEMGKSYSFVIFPLLNGARSLCASNIVNITTNKTDKIKECLVYTSVGKDNNEQNLIASDAINDLISYDIKSGNSNSLRYTKRVTFEVKWGNWALIEPSMGARGDMCMYVKVEGESGFREEKYWSAANVSLTKEYQKFSALIPHNTVAIEFRTGLSNGASYRYVRNLEVYKDFILETPISELDFGKVEPNVSVTKTFDITYAHDVVLSEIAYDNAMKTIIGDGLGFYKVEYADNDDCAEGSQTVTVTFTPTNCAKEYNATLTLINGAVLEIPLKGELKRNPGTVSEITWTGEVDTNWDNRNNWVKEDGTVLSAADVLSENLVVTLPAGKDKYPTLPDVSTEENFKTVRDNACKCSQVNAGDNATATKVADKIIMEYGASLVGVETLNAGGVSRYNEAEVKFEARRTEWLLVGAIVNPFEDGSTTVTREARSGDYYLNNLPHAYMHQAKLDANGKVGWDETFSDMYKPLNNDVVFALRLPNQYGPSRLPSTVYNRRNGTSYNGTQPCLYTFNGRFANESALPTYNVTPTQSVLLTNTYPANINAYKLQNGKGTILYYDYNQESFVPVGDNKNAEINAQHGFVFTPSEGVTSLSITKDDFNNTETGHRSAEQEVQSLRLRVANEIKSVSSEIYVRLDEAKDDEANYSVDAPKIFNTKALALPDVYAIRYDKKWSCLYVPTMSESVALGINVATAGQTFKFSLAENSMPFDVILEDRQTGIKYNLSNGEEFEVSDLEVGACEGRFYLAAEQKTEDDDVTTTIEENLFGENIDIFTQASQVVITSNSNILIKKVIISDLSGRTQVYESTDSEFYNNHYIKIDMPVSAGIYTINVISDSVVKTEKIRLN